MTGQRPGCVRRAAAWLWEQRPTAENWLEAVPLALVLFVVWHRLRGAP